MPSPFPGMDPYLEDPRIWSGVHAAILAAIFEQLGPAVRPKYVVRFEERVYLTGEDDPGYRQIIPDVRVVGRDWSRSVVTGSSAAVAEPIRVPMPVEDDVHERSLQVVDLHDRRIVTVIELPSPSNKVAGSFGRTSFLRKRREVLAGEAHWLEIDLLRDGVRTIRRDEVPPTEYQAFLSRSGPPREGFAYPIRLRDPLPRLPVPLREPDADAVIDLQSALAAAIERGSYDLDADYAAAPVPPLTGPAAEWARGVTDR